MWPVIAAAGLWCGRLILYLETNTLTAKAIVCGEFFEAADIFRRGFRHFFYDSCSYSIPQEDDKIEFFFLSFVPLLTEIQNTNV